MLAAADQLEPGHSLLRGHLLWELQQTLLTRITRNIQQRKAAGSNVDPRTAAAQNKKLLLLVDNARKYLNEAAVILAEEQKDSQEYKLASQRDVRMTNLDMLKASLGKFI